MLHVLTCDPFFFFYLIHLKSLSIHMKIFFIEGGQEERHLIGGIQYDPISSAVLHMIVTVGSYNGN